MGLDLDLLGRRQLAIDIGGQLRFNIFDVLGHVLSRYNQSSYIITTIGTTLVGANLVFALATNRRGEACLALCIHILDGIVRPEFPTDMASAHLAKPAWRE